MYLKNSYTKIPQQESDSTTPKVNFFSYITFGWLSNLIRTANERPLNDDDLPYPPGQISTQKTSQKYKHLWKLQLTMSNPQLWKVLVKSLDKCQICTLTILSFLFLCCRVLQPVFLNLLLKELIENESKTNYTRVIASRNLSSTDNHLLYGQISAFNSTKTFTYNTKTSTPVILYVIGLSTACLIQTVFKSQIMYVGALASSKVISGLTCLVYEKVLSTKRYHLDKFTTGHLLNLVSKDLETLIFLFAYTTFSILAPVEIAIVAFLLWQLVGIESVVSVGYLAIIILFNLAIGSLLQHIRRQMTKCTDYRLRLVCDVIAGIRVIKMNVWETLMERLIGQARRKELKTVFRSNLLRATFYTLCSSFINTASFIAISTLLYTGHVITARNVFTILTLMSIHPQSLNSFWNAVEYQANVRVTTERIQCLLLSGNDDEEEDEDEEDDEQLKNEQIKDHNKILVNSKLYTLKTKEYDFPVKFSSLSSRKLIPELVLSKVTSKITNYSFRSNLYEESASIKTILNSIDLQLSGSTLVAVIGKVGSGKSSLLNVILGELPLSQGEVRVKGTIAFVPQTAWLFSGSIQDNIVFGNNFDKKRYDDVIRACALNSDFEMLPHGDMTYVGERGVRLSGGQRARVNLARAVYHDADIYLLDDPLSAIDSKVGRHVFNECIVGLLSNRLRVLVTHHVHYLKYVNKTVIMEKGSLTNHTTLDEIQLANGTSLEELMNTKENNEMLVSFDGEESTQQKKNNERPPEPDNYNNKQEEEEKETGKISYKTYWKYLRSGSSIFGLVIILVLALINQCLSNGAYFWLSHWTKLPPKQQHSLTNLYIYSGIAFSSFSFFFIFTFGLLSLCVSASKELHSKMLSTLLRCPVRFFDTNPPGRILNRFSRDMCVIDDTLVERFVRFIIMSLTCIFDITIISVSNPILVAVTLPVVCLVISKVNHYLQASREVERLMAISGSPLYEHFVQSIDGADIIRAFDANETQNDKIQKYRDDMNKNLLIICGLNRWLTFRMDLSLALVVICVTVVSLLTNQGSASVGLLIFYAIKITTMWNVGLSGGDTENAMTSVERVIQYTELQRDPGYDVQTQPPEQWPTNGSLSFNDVTLTYYPGAPLALKGIDLIIKSGEKVGIVGRTGAGKSSIISALFRLPQVTSGSIVIDNVNIEDLNVKGSRNAIGCIPQDPFLFIGSLRFNLDPTDNYPTSQLWSVLDQVELKTLVESIPEGLDYIVNEGGSNFSVGQKQLLCLARALLQKKKIIVLDEATAHVDFTTDRLVQDTIRYKLKEQTVLAIAHRLDTVLDYDRVVVIDEGKVVESGQPRILIDQNNSLFASMYQTYILSHSTTQSC